ncbi:MAG: hypothetical protein VX764_05530 [Planctomycetota bacterium]|nr:hypothetical protein [Planctomycetota bacterium]
MIESSEGDALNRAGERWVTFFALLIPAVIAFHPLANNDLPLHLAIGDWIIEQGVVPTTDPFSANGHGGPWIAHEWLSALLFAVTYKLAGAPGLVWLATALAATIGALQDRIARILGVPAVARLLLLVPLWLVAGRRLMLRPHLLGLCSVLGLWWICLVGRARPQLLWLAVVVMALWANFHSSFILGIAFLLFDLLIWPDGHQASLRQRLVVFASCVGSTFLQPHGFDLYLFPFQLGLDPVFTSQVMEWVSPFSGEMGAVLFRQTLTFWIGVPLLMLGLVAVCRLGLQFRSGEVPRAARLASVVAITMALLQQRHFALAMLLASPPLGIWLTYWCQKWPHTMHKVRRRAAILITAVVLMLIVKGYPARFDDDRFQWRKTGTGWSQTMPRSPITILTDQWQVTGVVFCEYEFGSTVIHASHRRLRPTIDSRNTVYGADAFRSHLSAMKEPNQEQDRLLALSNAVLLRPAERDRLALTRRLATDPAWLLLHVGPYCQMWARRDAIPEQLRTTLPR